MSENKKGYNFEKINKTFTIKDIENLKPKQVFNDKWIILKNLGARGEAHCYDVCDKQAKQFGELYVEIGKDGMSSVANQVEFSHKHYSMGNSHRFTLIVDVGLINNHVFYSVVLNRPGPTLKALMDTSTYSHYSAVTVAFIAIDFMMVAELLISSGYVLRNIDKNQWKFDVKARMFYLADITDVCVISDKRYRTLNESHFTGETTDLHWRSVDSTYAPIAFCANGKDHRMSELDMIESFVYVLYEMARDKLPWKNVTNNQKMIEMKKEFMNCLPESTEKLESNEDVWLDTALRNVTEYLKLARKTQEKMERLPVRDGAWCPNGARAGALLSTVHYREIIEDFHKVVSSGRPVWSVHWRDVKLEWDREFQHTPKTLELLAKIEKREVSSEVAREATRLQGARVHYEIMKEHGEEEHRLNYAAIKSYLDGNQEEDEDVKANAAEKPVKRTRRSKKQKEKDLEVLKEEKKEEEEPEPESTSSSTSKPQTARAARLQRRRMSQAEEETVACKTEDDFDVKIEEPDGYEEDVPGPSEPDQKYETDSDCDIKIEEPDDY